MNDARSDTEAVETLRCRKCGSANVTLDGWDIDKCGDCGHWHYRGEPPDLNELIREGYEREAALVRRLDSLREALTATSSTWRTT